MYKPKAYTWCLFFFYFLQQPPSLWSYLARLQPDASNGVCAMKPELQQIFDNTPEDDPRSKLEPYRELILRWRRQGKSYRRITKLLAENCGLVIGRTALNEFVQRRSRPRKELEPEPVTVTPAAATPDEFSLTVQPVRLDPRRSPEEMAAARAALRAAYDQPVFPREEPKPLFVRDPSKRIRNLNIEGEK